MQALADLPETFSAIWEFWLGHLPLFHILVPWGLFHLIPVFESPPGKVVFNGFQSPFLHPEKQEGCGVVSGQFKSR